MNNSKPQTDLDPNLPSEVGHADDISLDTPTDNDTFVQDLASLEDASNTSLQSSATRGSHSVSGSEANPESDDDVLKNAHEMGIAPNASLSEVTELNLAKDIKDAEEYRKAHLDCIPTIRH